MDTDTQELVTGMYMPTVELDNGVIVANFCSPHSFVFDTGETLGRCSDKRSENLTLEKEEAESVNPINPTVTDITPIFVVTAVVWQMLIAAHHSDAHVILIPRILMDAVKEQAWRYAEKLREEMDTPEMFASLDLEDVLASFFPKIRCCVKAKRTGLRFILGDRFCK